MICFFEIFVIKVIQDDVGLCFKCCKKGFEVFVVDIEYKKCKDCVSCKYQYKIDEE